MNNEPVVWMLLRNESCVELTEWYGVMRGWEEFLGDNEKIVELYTHPAKTPAKQRYDDCMKDCDEPNPIERLRFFLSCALTGQDWLDVEPFIDAITHPAKTLTEDTECKYCKQGCIRCDARKTLTDKEIIANE